MVLPMALRLRKAVDRRGRARGEETAPDSLRLYGCFCMPGQPQEGIPGERKTIEVLEVDLAGHVSWLYGSPNALRVDEFGTRKCVTYTRQIIRRSGTIPGRIIRLDTYPGNCRVVEEDNDGNVFRQWLSLPPIPNPSVIGLRSCPLIAGQLLE